MASPPNQPGQPARKFIAMDFKQLEALAAVAMHGKFLAAADALGTVQSNISSRIARLEDELGTVLFDRGLSQLTPEGKKVLERVNRISTELSAIRDDVASMTSRITGEVRLGIIGTPARWLLPVLLDALVDRHPGIEITVTDAPTTSLVALLKNSVLDLAVINTPLHHNDLVSGPLWDEEMVVIAPHGHELAAKGDRRVTFKELAKHELVLGSPGTSLRKLVDEAATKHGVTLRSKAQLNGVRMAATMAFQGYGPAVVPITSIPEWAGRGNWNVLTLSGMPLRSVGLAFRRKVMLTSATTATRQLIRDVVHEKAPKIKGISSR